MHNGKKSGAHLVHASKLWEGFPFPEVDEGEITFNWGKKFCIDADSFSSGEPTSNGTLTDYTDGSVMKERAGSGFHY
jgi:hypothetical protein